MVGKCMLASLLGFFGALEVWETERTKIIGDRIVLTVCSKRWVEERVLPQERSQGETFLQMSFSLSFLGGIWWCQYSSYIVL